MITFNGNEQELIKILEEVSNNYENVVKDFESQNYKLNELETILQYYLRNSFLKMANLFMASFKLLDNPMPFPNEAKILIRSMFEHYTNFMYIIEGDEEQQKYKMRKFFDYQYWVGGLLWFYKNYGKEEKHKTKGTFKSIAEFKEKYNITKDGKLKTWSGKDFKFVFDSLCSSEEDKKFYRLYNSLCRYTHSNILHYYDKATNSYKNTPDNNEIIECLIYMNMLFDQFLMNFYRYSKMDWDSNIKINYHDKFYEIFEKYILEY